MTMPFREHPDRAILETCDPWDISSEWWGDKTWPKMIFETLITFLTIEDSNLNIQSEPLIKTEGSICNSCNVLIKKPLLLKDTMGQSCQTGQTGLSSDIAQSSTFGATGKEQPSPSFHLATPNTLFWHKSGFDHFTPQKTSCFIQQVWMNQFE